MYTSMIFKAVPQVHIHLYMLFKLRRCDIFIPKCVNWEWGNFLHLEALYNENFKFVLSIITRAWTLGLTQQWRTRLSPPLGVSRLKLPCQTSHDGHTPFLPETILQILFSWQGINRNKLKRILKEVWAIR